MKSCKECFYYNCNVTRKGLKCSSCNVSERGCRICYCVTINYNAELCKYYTKENKDEIKRKS